MKRWIAFALPVCVCSMLVAQNASGPPQGHCVVSFPFSVMASRSPSPLINGPFSAEVIFTSDKVLPSGEHLYREAHGKAYRDSQGRRRVEADVPGGSDAEPKALVIEIVDPVAGRNITLDSCSMTAEVYIRQPAPNLPTASAVQPAGAAAETASSVVSPAATVAPGPDSTGAAPRKGLAGDAVSKKSASSEELGTTETEGMTVSGTKSVLTVSGPVEKNAPSSTATTTTNVEWAAHDMGIVVLREVNDPQLGHAITKLANIIRTEPDPALFQIPSGYRVINNQPRKKEQERGGLMRQPCRLRCRPSRLALLKTPRLGGKEPRT